MDGVGGGSVSVHDFRGVTREEGATSVNINWIKGEGVKAWHEFPWGGRGNNIRGPDNFSFVVLFMVSYISSFLKQRKINFGN